MGLTKVTTKLTHIKGSGKYYEDVFLVDTGATDSLAPSDVLERIGVKKEGSCNTIYTISDSCVSNKYSPPCLVSKAENFTLVAKSNFDRSELRILKDGSYLTTITSTAGTRLEWCFFDEFHRT